MIPGARLPNCVQGFGGFTGGCAEFVVCNGSWACCCAGWDQPAKLKNVSTSKNRRMGLAPIFGTRMMISYRQMGVVRRLRLTIRSRQRLLPIVALPFCVVFALVVGLVGQMNMQSPVVQGEVQVKLAPTRLNSHPPLVMVHLFQMHGSAGGDNLIKSGSSIL